MNQKPFDFAKVKVVIKKADSESENIFLDKTWTYDNIAHFRPVIEGVSDEEGIEITLTCNLEAFKFVIRYLEAPEADDQDDLIEKELNQANVLNVLVTSDFLKLDHVFEVVWREYFMPNFAEIINKCQLNLSGVCSRIVADTAKRISLTELLKVKDRPDKFLSNVFRRRIDILLQKVQFYQCKVCWRIITEEQASKTSCSGWIPEINPIKEGEPDQQPEQNMFIDKFGKWQIGHVLQKNQVDKVKLLRFLRDE